MSEPDTLIPVIRTLIVSATAIILIVLAIIFNVVTSSKSRVNDAYITTRNYIDATAEDRDITNDHLLGLSHQARLTNEKLDTLIAIGNELLAEVRMQNEVMMRIGEKEGLVTREEETL